MMVDLDIPSSTQPTTFLHWIQTDLVASTTPETIMTSQGNLQGFGVNLAKNTTAIVAYTQPNPPAQNPLSHRYTQLLLDTSKITPAGLTALQTAAQNRVNFNINTTLQQAGLSQSVVAWNFFNVTNPGPVAAAANTATGTKGSSANTNVQGAETKKGKGTKGAASTATNTTATAGKTGDKGAKKAKGTASVASSPTSTTGAKKGKGGANVASTSNSTTSATGKKGGKKGGAGVTTKSNSTTSATGTKAGKKGKGGANSTSTATGKKGKGGKGSNSTVAGGAGTQVSSGAVTSNSSAPGTVTVSASPERQALHSILLSLCLVGAAVLAL